MDPAAGLVVLSIAALFVALGARWQSKRSQYAPYAENEEPSTELTVKGVCPGVSLVRERPMGLEGEVATGDLEFDRQFRLIGPEGLVRALFDVETRRKVLRLSSDLTPLAGLVLSEGCLSARVRHLNRKHRAIVKRRLGALAEALRTPSDIARRLAEALHAEPELPARRLQLKALARDHPEHPATIKAVRNSMKDEDPEIRLAAATAAGSDGRMALLALAGDADVADAVGAAAVEALGRQLGVEDAAAILTATVEPPRGHVVLQPSPRRDTARACVAALAQSGGPAAERVLVGLLAGDDDDVRAAAAAALGSMGSAGAVEALRTTAQGHGGRLRRVAQDAVARIQSRLTATGGEVALAAADTGEVSIADGLEGAVSLPPDPEKSAAD